MVERKTISMPKFVHDKIIAEKNKLSFSQYIIECLLNYWEFKKIKGGK